MKTGEPRWSWQRLESLFHQVVDKDPAARQLFLDQHCRDDAELRQELEALLAADGPQTTWSGLDLGEISAAAPEVPGYGDLELIDHGGMGSVYRAQRRDALFEDRIYAIKVLHAHRLEEHSRRRFAIERQLLASLDHPNIVRLYDGGELADGRPYLVMDYVEGQPLDAYCRIERLKIEERLRIFQTLCDALHHAHKNLVVHRDLKPANIRVDAAGVPHLLDFGIAKPLHRGLPATASRFVPMTPGYASPEQVAGHAITTASDIYSAGLVLVEMLTDRLPASPSVSRGARDPELPSSMIDGESEETANARGLSVAQLKRRVRGDLDHIAAKALRWQPEDRYDSARSLAEDIDRHLRHLPVQARRGGWRYASSRFMRRHRGSLVLICLLLMTAASAGLTAIQSWRLRAQSTENIQLIRRLAGPEQSQLMAIGSLDLAVQGILAQDEPAESKTLLLALVNRLNLPLEHVMDRSYEIFESQLRQGRADRQSAELARLLGEMLFHGGKNEASEKLLAISAQMVEVAVGRDASELAPHLELRARVLAELERFDEGVALWRRSLELRREAGGDPIGLARGQAQLANLLFLQGRYPEAVVAGRRALEILDRENVDALDRKAVLHGAEIRTALAVALVEVDGTDPEAEALAREALRASREQVGDEHMLTLQARFNLATILARSGRMPQALVLTEENLRAAEKSLGPNHSRIAYILTGLAQGYQSVGEPRRCILHARRAVELRSAELGALNWRTAVSKTRLASCLAELGQRREAAGLLQSSLWVFESSEVEDDKHLVEARAELEQLMATEVSAQPDFTARQLLPD